MSLIRLYIEYICVCAYVHMLRLRSATSVRGLCFFFYEADQTQGVILIYEAPRWLWRVQLDQKYTVPCQVHSVSTSWNLLCILCFIECVQNIIQDPNRLSCLFRMTAKSLSGVVALLSASTHNRTIHKLKIVRETRSVCDVRFRASATKDRLHQNCCQC